jgi:hypothetical protein
MGPAARMVMGAAVAGRETPRARIVRGISGLATTALPPA